MRAFELPDIESEWAKVFTSADKKNLKLSEKEIYDEIQAYRVEKKRKA
jgi:hypothetical protein